MDPLEGSTNTGGWLPLTHLLFARLADRIYGDVLAVVKCICGLSKNGEEAEQEEQANWKKETKEKCSLQFSRNLQFRARKIF